MNGRIRMKLDVPALADGSLASPHDSATKQIGDPKWSISSRRRSRSGYQEQYALGFFLKCHGIPSDPAWRSAAYAVLRVVAQQPGVDDLCKAIGHTFNNKEDDWGYLQFAQFDASLYRDFFGSGAEC